MKIRFEKIMKIVSKPNAIEIMKQLVLNEMRYKDLKKICQNDTILSSTLKDLREIGIIDTIVKKEGHKAVTLYKITRKGENVIVRINDIELLFEE